MGTPGVLVPRATAAVHQSFSPAFCPFFPPSFVISAVRHFRPSSFPPLVISALRPLALPRHLLSTPCPPIFPSCFSRGQSDGERSHAKRSPFHAGARVRCDVGRRATAGRRAAATRKRCVRPHGGPRRSRFYSARRDALRDIESTRPPRRFPRADRGAGVLP